MRQNRFKKRSQFQIFKLSNFTLTWSNDGKVCSVWADKAYSKELQQKSVSWLHLGTAIVFWWDWEESLPEKKYKNIGNYSNLTIAGHKVLLYNIHL